MRHPSEHLRGSAIQALRSEGVQVDVLGEDLQSDVAEVLLHICCLSPVFRFSLFGMIFSSAIPSFETFTACLLITAPCRRVSYVFDLWTCLYIPAAATGQCMSHGDGVDLGHNLRGFNIVCICIASTSNFGAFWCFFLWQKGLFQLSSNVQ